MSQPNEVHTLSGAYALDALTEIERAGFARHLAECSVCETEVAEFRETAARLGIAAWESPPARLRDRVMAEVAQTRQVSASSRPERSRSQDVALWRRRTAAAVAAGLIAIGGGTTAWVVQEQRVNRAVTEASQLESVLAAGDAQVHSTAVKGGGRITVAVSPSQGAAVAVMSDLPTLPKGKVYQLWLITGSNPATPSTVMAAGQTAGSVKLTALGTADTLAISIEPDGGSRHPTVVISGVPLV